VWNFEVPYSEVIAEIFSLLVNAGKNRGGEVFGFLGGAGGRVYI